MTKLEFIDRINDILIGLNTAESDALGSLYDELMRDAGWRSASEHPPVDKETGFSELVVGIMPGDTVGFPQYVRYQKNEFYDRWIYGYTGVPSAINIKWWCYPPKEE